MRPLLADAAAGASLATAAAVKVCGLTLPDWAAVAGIAAGTVSVVMNAPAALANLRRWLTPENPHVTR